MLDAADLPCIPVVLARDPNLRDHLFSFVRCLRVETDLAAAVLQNDLNLDQSIFYIFPLSVDLTDSDRVAAA